MPRRLPCLLLLTLAFTARIPAAEPADQARDLIAKYKAERTEAAKTFTNDELSSADDLAAKADAALAKGNPTAAVRLATDARWQLPVLPKGLPTNVVRVLGAGRLRHGDRVNALAYSPDGSKLATASRDGTVRIWDVGNGREVLAYRGHEAVKVVDEKDKEQANVMRVPGVSFSADGKRVASCGATEIHVWEADTGKLVATLKGHKKDVKAVAFGHKDPNLLVSVGDDQKLIVWDVAAAKAKFTSPDQGVKFEAVAVSEADDQAAAVDAAGLLAVFQLGEKVTLGFGGQASDKNALQGVAFARDGATVFVCGNDSKVKRLSGPKGAEAAKGTTLLKYEGHGRGGVSGVAVTPDGKQMVSVGKEDLSVLVWDIETGKQLRLFPGEPAFKEGTCVAVRPDGRQIAVGYESGSVRLIPFAAADEHRAFADAKDNPWAVAYSPDGKAFAVAGADRTVRVYETESGKLLKELTGHKLAVTAVAFVNPGTVVSAGGDKTVMVWDVASGKPKELTGHALAVLAVATDPTGKVLLTGGADKTVRGWDVAAGKELWKWDGQSIVCGLAVSADGKRAAVGCADGKLILLAIDGAEVKVTGETGAHSAGVAGVAFSPDGQLVATGGGDGFAKLWTAPTAGPPVEQKKFTPPFNLPSGTPAMPISSVAFSPDGKSLVGCGSEGVVRVWDVIAGTETRGLRGHAGWVTCVAYAPNGQTVLSCGIDKQARLFELPRADAAADGHRGAIQCVAVSRDGKYAATGGADRTVKVWDLNTGREVATLTGENEARGLLAVTFVGSDRVAACGADKKLRTWTFKPNKLVSEADTSQFIFALAGSEDGTTVGGAWSEETDDKQNRAVESGFDLFPQGGEKTVTKFKSKGSADAGNAAGISPDAKWGVIGGKDGVVRIWDVAKKERVGGDWPLLKSAVLDLGLTPDRKRVVVIDDAGEVRVADTDKREVLASVKAVAGEVRGVIVSPTADKFVTLSGDGEVKAWDMACKELRTWKLPQAATCAVFTADGKRLITGSQDGTALVLELP
jgi:WD40 repeat protein